MWNKYTWKEELHKKFQNFISHLIFDLDWVWLDALIALLCQGEMYFHLIKNRDLKDELEICNISSKPEEQCIAYKKIPENDLYCSDCPYHDWSKVAEFFYGYQSAGYCHYIHNGDFCFGNPTDILWDGCKCCGVNDELDWEESIITPSITSDYINTNF